MAALQSNDDLNTTSTDTDLHRVVHLDVTRTMGNQGLPISSSDWRQLKADVLRHENNTCSSCGYMSPDSTGRKMKINHTDGNVFNNHPANLRLHCPPCEAIHHCGLNGLLGYITLGSSALDQVEIVRKTREVFETTGTIPRVRQVDPQANRPDISMFDFSILLLETGWDNLSEEYRSYKGFFTNFAVRLFSSSTVGRDIFHRDSGIRANQIRTLRSSLPSVTFSPQEHVSLRNFLMTCRPSTTRTMEAGWIYVINPRPNLDDQENPFNVEDLISAWEDLCANQRASAEELDRLARRYKVLGGKWIVFSERDKVDALWFQIARSTHAGTLGTQARVSSFDEFSDEGQQAIEVFTKDYTNLQDVKRVRESLRRLGIKYKIGYKPDVYTNCGVYSNNPWSIRPSKYFE